MSAEAFPDIADLIDSLNKRWGVPFEAEDALKAHFEHNYSERRRLASLNAELTGLLDSVTPEKDAEGIILKAKLLLGGKPSDSLHQLCYEWVNLRTDLTRAVRSLMVALDAHIQADAERSRVKPERYCPCLESEMAEASAILKRIGVAK